MCRWSASLTIAVRRYRRRLTMVALLTLVTFWILPAIAQGPSPTVSATPVSTQLPTPVTIIGELGEIWKKLRDNMVDSVWLLLTTGLAAAAAWLGTRLRHFRKIWGGNKLPLPKTQNDHHNWVFVAGIGGSGKTHLIRALSGHPRVNVRAKTGKTKIYSTVNASIWEEQATVTRLYFVDYRGQDMAEFIQFSKANDLAFNSLILVVDLFDTPDNRPRTNRGWNKETRAEIQARAETHIRHWDGGTLEALVPVLRGSRDLAFVGLFINKLDLLKERADEQIEAVEEIYNDLKKLLHDWGADAVVSTYVGSAEWSWGTGKVLEDLISCAPDPER